MTDVEIVTDDGVSLRAIEVGAESKRAHGTIVMAHAMFARKSEFLRPEGNGVANFFASRGWNVVAFDFRGHGESGPGRAAEGATYTYDDLVMRDLPAVVHAARARTKGKLVVLGHSLGAHVSLAAQGCGFIQADALVSVAGNVWIRDIEPSRTRWLVKRAVMRATFEEVAERRGYFPARALRQGSDDESLAYVRQLVRITRDGIWRSADGQHDYFAGLARVSVPVYAIASDGDRLNAHPECVRRFHALLAGKTFFDRLERADDGGRPPDHMGLVTTLAARSAFVRAEAWLR